MFEEFETKIMIIMIMKMITLMTIVCANDKYDDDDGPITAVDVTAAAAAIATVAAAGYENDDDHDDDDNNNDFGREPLVFVRGKEVNSINCGTSLILFYQPWLR